MVGGGAAHRGGHTSGATQQGQGRLDGLPSPRVRCSQANHGARCPRALPHQSTHGGHDATRTLIQTTRMQVVGRCDFLFPLPPFTRTPQ